MASTVDMCCTALAKALDAIEKDNAREAANIIACVGTFLERLDDLKWVSVEDRLPEVDEDWGISYYVLLYAESGYWLGYLDERGSWWNESEHCLDEEDIAYWMPIPEAP